MRPPLGKELDHKKVGAHLLWTNMGVGGIQSSLGKEKAGAGAGEGDNDP